VTPELKLWYFKAFEKFALLGIPTIVALLVWKKLRVESKTFYQFSWANPICYLLWILAIGSTNILIHSVKSSWITFSMLPASVAFIWPFFAAFGSLCLCLLCGRANPKEQAFVLLPNLLMLILWGSSIVAPN